MRFIKHSKKILILLCALFFSRDAVSTSAALLDTLAPKNVSYSYFIKHWESELLISFSAPQITVAPAISIHGELLKLQEVFEGLNTRRLYSDNVYVSVESSRDYKDYNFVHIFIEADEVNDPSGSRRDKGNIPLKYLFVKIYKNGTFEAKLIEDK